MKDKNNVLATVFLIGISSLYILIGFVMLFVSGVKNIYLTYCICGLLILFGIILIIRYFVKESYRSVNEYGFSLGTLLVIGGACGLARSVQLTDNIKVFLGLCLLVTSVVMLQNMIQLKALESKLWILMLVVSVLSIFCSIIIIVNMFGIIVKLKDFTYWALLINGIISLVSLLIVKLRVKRVNKMNEDLKATLLASKEEQIENVEQEGKIESEDTDGE